MEFVNESKAKSILIEDIEINAVKHSETMSQQHYGETMSTGGNKESLSCNIHTDLSEEASNNLSNQKNTGGTSSDMIPQISNSKVNLVGGHINQIQIEDKSVLIKKTSLMEVL